MTVVLVPLQAAAQIAELKRMSLEELSRQEVISVSRAPEPYGQAPAAIQVITAEEIRRSGATTLPEVLRLADALIVAQKNAHDWAISARGFNTDLANKLLVLIDGRTVYTPLFSGVFWDRQDYLLEDIERIEVVSGPGGTLWGANAVNGVINIITKEAKETQGLYGEGAAGTQVRGLAGARYGGAVGGDTFYRFYGKHIDRDNEFLPGGAEASDRWHVTRAGFRFDGGAASRDSWTLLGDIYDGDEHVASGGSAEVSGGNVLGRWRRTLSPDSGLTLQVYYDRTHLTLPVPAQRVNSLVLAPAGTLVDDRHTVDADFQHRFRVAAHSLTWGAAYRFTHDRTQNAPALGFEPPVLDQSLASAFVQDDIALTPTLSLIAGTKVEHNDYTGFEAEPSARLRWSPRPSQMLWTSVSRAVRMPARVDRDERLGTPALSPFIDNLLIGGADFESETLIAYEGGYRGRVAAKLSASVSVFQHEYDNLRSTNLSPPDPILGLPFPLFFANDLEGTTRGIELSAVHQPFASWRLHGAYTFLDEEIRIKPGRTDFNNGLNETADPRHQVNVRSAVTLGTRYEWDTTFRWIGALVYNNAGQPARLPDYAELGTRFGVRVTRVLELSVVGANLLRPHHAEYVISTPNPREEIGRSVYGKLAVRF